jgi:hypothetical protein
MSLGGDEWRPTPAMMPKRRPVIPPAQRPPARSQFQVAVGIPRRGLRDAIVWPDTGLLLALGTDESLLERFRRHYRGRIRLAKRVAREVRLLSEDSTAPDARDQDFERVDAATRVVRSILLGTRALPLVELCAEDLADVGRVTEQLKALSDTGGKSHGGEAEIIVLAAKAANRNKTPQVLLANDGGASVIAHRYGVPTRHIGDLLAEFACSDLDFAPGSCLAAFNAAIRVSAPPARSRPTGVEGFTCSGTATGCVPCDNVERTS